MEIKYEKDQSGRTWWCNSHQRLATFIRTRTDGKKHIDNIPHCDPNLGGILLPCFCVDLTELMELDFSDEHNTKTD